MISIKKYTSLHPDFTNLVSHLDAYLAVTDGDEHSFYNQFNKVNTLPFTVVAYINNTPVGCGALRPKNSHVFEVKRMFVLPTYRRKGIAKQLLIALETWAKALKASTCVLETGKRQLEAVAFYKQNGYVNIPNFEPYIGMENSLCFKKDL